MKKKLTAIDEHNVSARRCSDPEDATRRTKRTMTFQHSKCMAPHPSDPSNLPVSVPVTSRVLFFTSYPLKEIKPNPFRENHNVMEDLRTNKEFIAALLERVAPGAKPVSSERLVNDLPPKDVSNIILEYALQQQDVGNLDTACLTSPTLLNPISGASSDAGLSTSTTDLRSDTEVALIAETEKYLMVGRKPELTISAPSDILFEHNEPWENTFLIHFFNNSSCYDLMPSNSRVVILDSQLPIGKAFRAILFNGLRAAPVWNSHLSQYCGMITLSDFIRIFLQYHDKEGCESILSHSNDDLEGIEAMDIDESICTSQDDTVMTEVDSSTRRVHQHKLSRDILVENGTIDYWMKRSYGEHGDSRVRELWCLTPAHSLLSAIHTLHDKRVHRFPVLNPRTGNLHYILTQKRLLEYLYVRLPLLKEASTSLWNHTLRQCDNFLGTWGSALALVTPGTFLVTALKTMLRRRVSSLPVVDHLSSKILLDIFTKFDFMYIGSSSDYKRVHLTVQEALDVRNRYYSSLVATIDKPRQPLCTCLPSDTILEVMQKLVICKVNRLLIIESDENRRVLGVITVSDLLRGFTMTYGRRASA